jgi:predicted metal-dependent hydrolase
VSPAGPRALREVLRRGAERFNAGDYFGAHEVWEEGWRQEEGEPRALLQGLIQIAAGFVKWQRGEPAAVEPLLARGLAKIEVAGPEAGIDVSEFAAAVRKWAAGRETGAGAPILRIAPPYT